MHQRMKRLLLILFSLCGLALFSQADTIVKKDGTEIKAFNVEEAGRWVLYTLGKSADSPLQRIAAEEVREILHDTDAPAIVAQTVPTVAAADNVSLIERYNKPVIRLKKKKKSSAVPSDIFVAVWGFTPATVLSDDNVEISFVRQNIDKAPSSYFYKIRVNNKTDHTLYVDLANSFKVNSNGSSEPYFSASEPVRPRILEVPAHSAAYMPGTAVKDGDRTLQYYEPFYFRNKKFNPWFEEYKSAEAKCYSAALNRENGLDNASLRASDIKAMPGEYKALTPADSPKIIKRMIAYSDKPDGSDAVTLPVEMYVRGVFGSYIKPSDWAENSSDMIWGVSVVEKDGI